ncbi:gastrin/cholecystokinin-like peptide [Myripristis murdjan]|uniref:gastrin/cholecystokinin-like peptide n=1 Tax=Myripristis murdjan TaxID=586833 RepID=UPI001175FECA|nr:gastrin/cholecystokinin-like peptide [Myripristis murdjan]
MAGHRIMVCAFVAALLVCGMASPRKSPSARDAKESGTLQQLLERSTKDSAGQQEQAAQTHAARTERLTQLSEDERELMTKQIMQAISEIMNSECMSDRDYKGWVDFGRRSTE